MIVVLSGPTTSNNLHGIRFTFQISLIGLWEISRINWRSTSVSTASHSSMFRLLAFLRLSHWETRQPSWKLASAASTRALEQDDADSASTSLFYCSHTEQHKSRCLNLNYMMKRLLLHAGHFLWSYACLNSCACFLKLTKMFGVDDYASVHL